MNTSVKSSNREITATILSLAWPTIVEQIFQTIVMYVDSAMVGRIGAHASAAVGVCSTATWLTSSLCFAAGVGFLAVISRDIGAGDQEHAKKTSAQALLTSLLLGAVIAGLAVLVSGVLPGWMGAEKSLHHDASIYFAIVSGALLLRCPTIVFGSVLRAASDMRSPLVVNAATNIINIIANFFLIYDTRTVSLGGISFTVWGAGLGVAGAAWGTALSYAVGFVMMLVVVFRSPLVSPKGYSLLPDKAILQRVIQIAVPNALQRTVVCLGHIVFTAQVTGLGTIPLAAHSIAITAEEAFYMPGSGFQAAATTLSGQALGAGDKQRVKKIASLCSRLCIAVHTVTGLLLFLFPEVMMSIFTPDPQVIALGASVLRIVSVSEPFFGLTMVMEGVFSGIGDTKPPFYVALFSMWFLRILPTFICVRFLHLGLQAVWCCMILEVIGRSILLAVRYAKKDWDSVS